MRAIEARQKTDRRRPGRRRAGQAVARAVAPSRPTRRSSEARGARRRDHRAGREARRADGRGGQERRQGRGRPREGRAPRPRSSRRCTRAREQLREQVAALAVAGAEKILRREVDAKAHAELLDSAQERSSSMAELTTIARPYAEAAFRLADAQDALAEWSEMLGALAAVARGRARARGDRRSRTCPTRRWPGCSSRVLAGKLDGERGELRARAGRERAPGAAAARSAAQFEALKNEREGVVEAEVTTAFALDRGAARRPGGSAGEEAPAAR